MSNVGTYEIKFYVTLIYGSMRVARTCRDIGILMRMRTDISFIFHTINAELFGEFIVLMTIESLVIFVTKYLC